MNIVTREGKFCEHPELTETINCEYCEIKKLKADNAKMREALEFLIGGEPSEPSTDYECTFCDMGGSGYSSKGDGHHDDVKHICPVYKAREILAEIDKGEK